MRIAGPMMVTLATSLLLKCCQAFVTPIADPVGRHQRQRWLLQCQSYSSIPRVVTSTQTWRRHRTPISIDQRWDRRPRTRHLIAVSLTGKATEETVEETSNGGTRGNKYLAGQDTTQGKAVGGKQKNKTVFIRPLVMPESEPIRRYGKPWSGERLRTTKPVMPTEKRADVTALQTKLFEKRKGRLIADHIFLGLLGTSGAWCVSFKAACSFGLGAFLGTFYLVLLARFVQNIGKEGGGGGGGGSARLVLAVLLVLLCTKNKDTLDLIPAVMGFLTYQAAALVQAVYTDFDRVEDAQSS